TSLFYSEHHISCSSVTQIHSTSPLRALSCSLKEVFTDLFRSHCPCSRHLAPIGAWPAHQLQHHTDSGLDCRQRTHQRIRHSCGLYHLSLLTTRGQPHKHALVFRPIQGWNQRLMNRSIASPSYHNTSHTNRMPSLQQCHGHHMVIA